MTVRRMTKGSGASGLRRENNERSGARYDDNVDALPNTSSFGDDLPAFLAKPVKFAN